MDTKARELLGFVGIILGLLATATSQSGPVAGFWGGVFYTTAVIAVAALLGAGIHLMREMVLSPPKFHDIGSDSIALYRDDPVVTTAELEEIQMWAFYDLAAAAEENSDLLGTAHNQLSAGYGLFAVGLASAAIAIVALIISFI
ncbi:MAG: hypothetical protein ACTHNP_11475 [Solirubrobacterales bacterium]